jgi:hypothetical protein
MSVISDEQRLYSTAFRQLYARKPAALELREFIAKAKRGEVRQLEPTSPGPIPPGQVSGSARLIDLLVRGANDHRDRKRGGG